MNTPSLLLEDLSLAQALDAWRSAARVVRDAWHDYLAADRPSARAARFGTYVDALNVEADAADVLLVIARSA